MSNFGDDLDEDIPAAESGADQAEPRREERDPDSFWNRKWVRMPLRAGMGLFIIGTAVSLYWTRIPKPFDVEEAARARALEAEHRMPDQPLPRGYRTIATMIELGELLLEKPGGYQSDGFSPMTRIPDNMRNWEHGFVIQMRVLVQGLRFELSRPGPQSTDHPLLNEAEARFNFTHNNIVLPSSGGQYREGLGFLKQYLDQLNSAQSPGKYFAPRNDQLIRYLDRQKNMLGNYTSKLQNNIGAVTYDTGMLTSTPVEGAKPVTDSGDSADTTKDPDAADDVNGFFERDNVFYEVRGGVFALYHTMLALRTDCEDVINAANAMGIMNRVLNELESANKPMRSPMVLNGNEFGIIQNHSIVLTGHLAKAHLAIQELQRQLAGGGGN